MNYLDWNDRIASHFFKPEVAGKEVFLYVTEEQISSLSASVDIGFEDFIEAIHEGPPWAYRRGLCQKALQSMQSWRSRSLEYPPYIGYLALFVLAAGIEGDFGPLAYYPRLREILGEQPAMGQYPSFPRMLELWDDLEIWANEDKDGSLGFFHSRITIGWKHVGLPIAQLILSEQERNELPKVFARAGLDPTSPASESELAFLISEYGSGVLRRQTLRLLSQSSTRDSEIRSALLAEVEGILRDWDGEVPTPDIRVSGAGRDVYASLRVCCLLDEVSGAVNLTYRCSTNHDYPESGLSLMSQQYGRTYSCEEYGLGWSTELKDSQTNSVSELPFDIERGAVLKAEEEKWHVSLPGSQVRILVPGDGYGLPGLIEVRQLPYHSPFYLLVKDPDSVLERWGNLHCEDFRELYTSRGLPTGWNIYHAAKTTSDALISDKYPRLSLASTLRISFKGGLRIDQRNRFFSFAPPKIVVDGPQESLQIFCDDVVLNRADSPGVFLLPSNVPKNRRLIIEAHYNGEIVRRMSIVLFDPPQWRDLGEPQWIDSFGNMTDISHIPRAAGALVESIDTPELELSIAPPKKAYRKLILVGRQPGQIVDSHPKSKSQRWSPVWAIALRRRGSVQFCGTSLEEAEPILLPIGSRRAIKKWKRVIFVRRKRLDLPTHPALKELWSRYLECARGL